MSSKALKRFILPLVVFPVLTSLTLKYMIGPLEATGLAAKLEPQCNRLNISPYALPYTGYSKIDARLCGLIAFFHSTMDEPVGLQFITYFLGTGAIITLFPWLEAFRSRKNFLLAFPLIWLLVAQVVTIAISMNVYSLIFILTGSHLTKKKQGTKITQSHAESLIFGLLIGLVIPSFGILFLRDPQVTALWQIYPTFMSIASAAHLLVRPPCRVGASGWPAVQALLLGIFILSSSLHFASVWPVINDDAALKALFIPSLVPLSPSTPIGLQTLDFLKWDFVFAFASPIAATFWFPKNVVQFLGLMAWYISMIHIVGPGAALTGVLLWREAKLH